MIFLKWKIKVEKFAAKQFLLLELYFALQIFIDGAVSWTEGTHQQAREGEEGLRHLQVVLPVLRHRQGNKVWTYFLAPGFLGCLL